MLNDMGQTDPKLPENWGGPDELPLARPRDNKSAIEIWRETGNLHPAVESAAYEIENCHRAIVAGGWTKTSSYGERTSRGPDTDWPARIAIAVRDRYGPWRDAMAIRYSRTGEPVYDIVIDVVAHCRSFREIDRNRQWRKSTASKLARWGLWEYARMAGWVRDNERSGH